MTEIESTRPDPLELSPGAPPTLGLDRDMAFAEAERRLLGRELRPVTLDRFVILRRVGQGAMGVVYAAHDPKLDRTVALKLVDTSGFGSEGVAAAQQRLEREARAAASLSHPNVVAIYDTGTVGDQVFLAMEFVEGTTLGEWLEAGHDWRTIVSMFIDAAQGLAAAHEQSIVHRDFKPDNVLVGEDGRPRVVDFGLARPVTSAVPSSVDFDRTRSGSDSMSNSHTGPATAIAGTPAYMAPEQYEGRNIGPHSDQFGFAVALHEALLGSRPFVGDNAATLATAVLEGKRQPISRGHGVPSAVLTILDRALARRPAERYPSMHDLIAELRSARDGGRRRRQGMLGALVVVGSIGATYGLTRSAEPETLDPCAAAAAPLAEVWNDERRATLRAALDDAAPFGTSSWTSIERSFDNFATRWTDYREQACQAAQHRGEQSPLQLELRYACLDRALRRMDVYIETIESAGMMAPIRGKALVDGLDRLSRCDNSEDLVLMMHGNGLATQTDLTAHADGLERWNAGYETLDRAEAQFVLGDADGAIELAEQVVADARQSGLRILQAEAQLAVGHWSHEASQLEEALDLAVETGIASQAAEIAIAIAELATAESGGNAEVAREHLRYAERFLARYGDDAEGSLAVRIPAVRGTLEKRHGNNEAARKNLELARQLAQQRLPPDHPDFIPLLGALGQTYRVLGDTDRARELMQQRYERQVTDLGADHPDVGVTLFELGVASLEDRELDDAAKRFTEAEKIWTKGFGAEHPQTSLAQCALGEVARRRGDLDLAHRLQTQALATREAAMGPQSPMLADPLDELGDIAVLRGDLATARARFERALKIRRAVSHLGLPVTLTKLGRLRAAEADPSEGLAMLEEALQLRSKPGFDPLKRAETELALAQAVLPSNRERARVLGRAAVDRYRAEARRPGERAQAERWYLDTFGEGSLPPSREDSKAVQVPGLPPQ